MGEEYDSDFVASGLTGLELAELVVVELQAGRSVNDQFIDKAVESCLQELDRVRTDASRGSHSMGGPSAFRLSVELAMYGAARLWAPLIGALSDPNVAQIDKGDGLAQLAAQETLPMSVSASLRESWSAISNAAQDPFHESNHPRYVGSILRLGYRIDAISRGDYVVRVSKLSSGSALEQIQALGVLAWCTLEESLQVWASTLALQLSLSLDPAVRANSGFCLSRHLCTFRAGLVPELVTGRLVELLAEDGVTVPELALRGLGENPTLRRDQVPLEVLAQVRLAANEHISSSVRAAAAHALEAILKQEGGRS
ncbi:hypothetical protein GCM10025792_23990 [Pseudonocardia tropica]